MINKVIIVYYLEYVKIQLKNTYVNTFYNQLFWIECKV